MVVIPAGSFRMGCLSEDDDCRDNEFPVRTVNLPSFAMSKYEITHENWSACKTSGACSREPDEDRGDWPVGVHWIEAQVYVEWLSTETGMTYRLPSESEWEYAARAGTETKYYWGDTVVPEQANCRNCARGAHALAPVGLFPPNPWGLYDILGNFEEMTDDCYNPNYRGAPTDGSAWLAGSCGSYMRRGGSYDDHAISLRVALRDWGKTGGLRVVRELEP